MKGRGIGTARGRATIMRAQCTSSFLASFAAWSRPVLAGQQGDLKLTLLFARSSAWSWRSWKRAWHQAIGGLGGVARAEGGCEIKICMMRALEGEAGCLNGLRLLGRLLEAGGAAALLLLLRILSSCAVLLGS